MTDKVIFLSKKHTFIKSAVMKTILFMENFL